MAFENDRYESMMYRRCGRHGLLFPIISLGLWQGTGSYIDDEASKRIIFSAFNHGITHFDLANNYGSRPGQSEILFGRILGEMPRHELLISSKAGYRMWPGPYGDGGSRKYIIESCEQSLRRLGIDHLDIFYSHRPDPGVPLEETIGALQTLVQQGKALYIGVSNYADPVFTRAIGVARDLRGPELMINQPRYNLLDRKAEQEVLPTAGREGIGVIAFSPLAQGLLTGKYQSGIPEDSRMALGMGNGAVGADRLTPGVLERVRKLAAIAQRRGQSLAQMSLAWVLRDDRVTSVLIGASKPQQVLDCIGSIRGLAFTPDEISDIEQALR